MENLEINPEFWSGRRVLVTGHTGFKGAWLALWLELLGAKVFGLSLAPIDDDPLFDRLAPWVGLTSYIGDIRNQKIVRDTIFEIKPEIVFHLAAQALVRAAHDDPIGTFATNVMGTAHILDAITGVGSVRATIVVTSDKVYNSEEQNRDYCENDPLGGGEAYGASKACTEHVASVWRQKTPLITVRAGNVIGGGDNAADRLIPDIFRAVRSLKPLKLRHPNAIRPWQHVLEPLRGYLMTAQALANGQYDLPPSINFGPRTNGVTVSEVIRTLSLLGIDTNAITIDTDLKIPEAMVLRLDSHLAEKTLGWTARMDLMQSLSMTAEWYTLARNINSMRQYTQSQIESYQGINL